MCSPTLHLDQENLDSALTLTLREEQSWEFANTICVCPSIPQRLTFSNKTVLSLHFFIVTINFYLCLTVRLIKNIIYFVIIYFISK
jgi:hypothetical protein